MSSAGSSPSVRILDPDNYKARVVAMFDGRSSSYDTNSVFHPRLAAGTVDRANLQPGERVLDLASGTGLCALDAAQRVGPKGSVLGVDLTDTMLAVARKKAEQQGLRNVRFEVGDVDALALPPGGFDAALCSNGMLYFQDIAGALCQVVRWLRRGGRLVFNTPVAPMFKATSVLHQLVQEHHGLPLVDAGMPLADPPTVRALLLASGFAAAEVTVTEEVHNAMGAATPEEYAEKMWRMNTMHAIAPLRSVLSEQQVEALRQPFLDAAAELANINIRDSRY
ncbi:hypothetical protein WJX81_008199 [Elliptochloris bilobata]|uniref:Methyltransferase domain-containing protein n=1 Tax=Elliptochloris bilobata TaxID=381761 RepID=A0AAW1R3N2_9CHLO